MAAAYGDRIVTCERCHFEVSVEGIEKHLQRCGKPLARCRHVPAHTAAWRCSEYVRHDIGL